MFSPAAQRVFDKYESRLAAENEQMRHGDPSTIMARRDEWLIPVGPEAGMFLYSLAVARGAKRILELGTSYGYSTLFLANAAKHNGGQLVTMELSPAKQSYARKMLEEAMLADVVDWQRGDAVALIAAATGPFDMVLLDIWKELYLPCLEAFYPKLSDEAVVVADNMIEPPMFRTEARAYRRAIINLPDMQSVLLPVGSGLEVSVKWPQNSAKL